MRLLRPLLANLLVALVLSQAIAWWMIFAVFPFAPAQLSTLAADLAAGLVVELGLVTAAVGWLAGPLRGAEGSAAEAPFAAAALRLPNAVATAALLAGGAASALVLVLMRRQAIALDVALAAAGVGVATAILGSMASFALASTSAGQVLLAVGGAEGPAARWTVRGKILVVAMGLNTVAFLLLGAAGYVRYRADTDAEYVAAGERAIRGVLEAGGASDAALAERAFRLTAAPTTLFEPSGSTQVHFGGLEPSLARARPVPGTLPLEHGWVVGVRAPGGGVLASYWPEDPLLVRRRAFAASLAWVGLLESLAVLVLAWMAARTITVPFRSLNLAAERIAGGDLTAHPPSISADEIGQLASDFRRMTHGLAALVVDVQDASRGVSAGAREVGGIGDRVRRGALGQRAGLDSVQSAVAAMEASMAQVSRGVGSLSEYVQATTRTVGESTTALDVVRRHGAELDHAVDTALTDVENLANAGREVESTLGDLEALASHAVGTLSTVRASVAGLERAAGESEGNAALVAEMAERSGGVVEETVHGIETLRAAVSDAHRRVTALGRRSDDIDQVVDFISEVAGRTNLLSLNASIIAAQAGEHGKAFAVVADQIRDLAAQIARSTKSIGDIIHAVREDVEATAALIDRGDALAVEGVQLARNSLEALGQIQRTTVLGRDTASAIRLAVEGHAGSSREVAQLVESVANGSRTVTTAVQLVGRSVAGVGAMSRNVNALAAQVSRALEEQVGHGRRQMESLSRLERMIGELTRAVDHHDAATRGVHDSLGQLTRATGDHESAVDGLSNVSDRLGARARSLTERIDRFKVTERS
jgi:methyl-accepting chemotaxis protein